MTDISARVDAVWRIDGARVVATLAKVTGDRRASATKKIALCNQKLGLAERDGVTD